ncbi:MAG TPA: leucyl/phenylalanyl-tRNA--protein transferase [Burkholderiales bacterium]|nr:leucyl/phenylalanyl-tRNA--protein transferase [Burkholderiales bacterium]
MASRHTAEVLPPPSDVPAQRAAAPGPGRRGREWWERVIERGRSKCQRALVYASAALPGGPIAGLCSLTDRIPPSPELLLLSCAQGLFPMDEAGKLRWHAADPRAVLMLERLHVPSRVAQYLRKEMFDLRFDNDVEGVLAGCAGREETWLTPRLIDLYRQLHHLGALHSVEAWQQGRLAGGAFGIALGRVFTVESMFSRVDHASKIAFVHLAKHLAARGYDCIDCQVQKPHFARFGAVEISLTEYRERMARGLARPALFHSGNRE